MITLNPARSFNAPVRWCFLAVMVAVTGCDADQPADQKPAATSAGDDNAEEQKKDLRALGELKLLTGEIENTIENKKWTQASRLIERGLKRIKTGPRFELTRARFLLLRGNLARERGDVLDSRRDYADSMAIFRVQGDPVGRFEVHMAQGRLEETLGDQAAAARQIDEAAALLPQIKDDNLRGVFLVNTGRLAARSMKHKEAYESFLEASKLFASLKDRRSQARTMIYLADTEDALGETAEGRRSLSKALSLYGKLDDKLGKVVALRKLASLAERDKKYKRARSLLLDVKAIYEDLGKQGDAIKVEQHINALPEQTKKKKK